MHSSNSEQLEALGVTCKALQQILIAELPCGIVLVEDAMNDNTSIQINAPRAMMLVHWNGKLSAMIAASKYIDTNYR